MNEEQKRAIRAFAVDRIRGRDGGSRKALDAVLGFDIDSDPQAVFNLLEESRRLGDPDSIECALTIAHGRTGDIDMVPTLMELLLSASHHRHEDVALWLQRLRDPRAVDALYAAALTKYEQLRYNHSHAFARKCTWALADIGTSAAQEALRRLATCDDPEVAGYAMKRLDGWTAETDRKSRPRLDEAEE